MIEKSLQKKYKKEIYSKFIKAIKDYKLIKENDKVAVCVSGGKDSFLLAKCMEVYQKYYNFEVKYILMDPGYSKLHLKKIKDNAKKLNIKLDIFKTDIFKIIKDKKSPCYFCAKMRRGYLYNYAKQLGCNKIALGHHFDDVIETVFLNMFYNGTFGGMPPILKSKNFENMELIRPLYYVKEENIIKFNKSNDLEFIDCACVITKKSDSKRKYIKDLIKELKTYNENIDINIFRSLENINFNTTNDFIKNSKSGIINMPIDDTNHKSD